MLPCDRPLKALLLTQNYPPEPGSASQKMSELAHHLADKGHQVTVVTGFPNYPDGVLHEGYRRKPYQREQANGVTVMRTFLLVAPRTRAFGPRMKNYLSLMATSIYGGLLSGRHDLVYVYSPPLFLGLSAYALSRMYRAPFVMDLNDLWPKGPIHLGVLRNPTMIRLAEGLERFVYSKADHIFFYSRRMRQDVVDTGVPEAKTEVHPLWVDTEVFRPAPQEEGDRIRRQYGMGDKLVAMYTGNLGLPQGLDTALRSAKVLQDASNDRVLFVMVGGGADQERLTAMREELGLDNVMFVPPQPVTAMPAFMSAADILLLHLDRAPFRLGTVPGKLLTYMSAARPVLAGLEGESADIVRDTRCGVVVEPQDPHAMAQGALDLTDPQTRRRMGEAGRNAAVNLYDRRKLLDDQEARLREIVALRRGRVASAKSA